jgi:catechol 2,3-dioxygenase
MSLSSSTRLGPVHLVVRDLERSSDFYADAIGLRTHRREDGVAALGAGAEDLLVLHEEPGAGPGGLAGLYNFALLQPSRAELARAARRLAAARTAIQGASDHGFSEAIYLADPDGNGIELYAD